MMGGPEYFDSRFTYDPKREGVWKAIVSYLLARGIIPPDSVILELGAGYCHFINNVRARLRYALDSNEQIRRYAGDGVNVLVQPCHEPLPLASGSMDVVFASNLFEHLDREQLHKTTIEVHRVLRVGGRLIVIQPNYRYCYRDYFDDYTHILIFSHLSLADYFVSHGFRPTLVIPRFLPFSMRNRLPKAKLLVSFYLRLPIRPFAKQMLLAFERT